MSRPLRKGDRVNATARVEWVQGDYAAIYLDGLAAGEGCAGDVPSCVYMPEAALTLITPAEPPVGSVVVKDGVAWARTVTPGRWYAAGMPMRSWDDISDGDVIFTAGDVA